MSGPQEEGDQAPPGAPWATAERLLDALGHAVIAIDRETRVHWWNPAAERLYGWTAEEVLGRPIGDIAITEVNRPLWAEIQRELLEGREWSGEFAVRRKDGTTFPALVTDSGIYDDDGALIGSLGVSTDLGVALQPLLARSSDAAVVLTRESVVSFVSPAAARLFGWTPETTLGRSLWDLLHPGDRAAAVEHQRRITASPDPVPPLEVRVACGDQDCWCWVEIVMTDLLGDPAVRGVVCNLRDVTERRADRDRLAELTEQLQTALTSRVAIEQAKGVVSAVRGVTVEEAFEVLRRHARDHNLPLQAVAQAVVGEGLRP